MAKKKQNKISPSLLKMAGIILLALLLGFGLYWGVSYGLLESSCFQVKSVQIDPSLVVIDQSDFDRLKGQNIFKIDLRQIQEKLGRRYPQVARLRVTRQFPDQITVVAVPRQPVAQLKDDSSILTIDEHGVVLSTSTPRDEKFPYIEGLALKGKRVILGQPLGGDDVKAALALISAFQANRVLESYFIQSVNVANTSKIEFVVSNGLKVYVDHDQLPRKMRLLGFVLTRADLDFNDVNYLDLRFKEPVIGKK